MIKTGQKKVDPSQKQKVDKDHVNFSKLLKERKGKVLFRQRNLQCNEILNELLDHIPKKKDELADEIGLEMLQ